MPRATRITTRSSPRRAASAKATVRVSRWGNSLALRIPASAVERLGLDEGSQMSIHLSDKAITLRPSPHEPTLDELLAGVTPAMVGGEVDWGKPVGKEMW